MFTTLDDQLFQAINSLVGRSWLIDTLLGYPLRNSVVKAAVVGGCYMAAWYSADLGEESLRRRRALLAGVLAAVFAIAASKAISPYCAKPRPFAQSSTLFVHQGDQLMPQRSLPFRVPREHFSESRHRAM